MLGGLVVCVVMCWSEIAAVRNGAEGVRPQTHGVA